jgi:tetratricopeptide (TPR) repeat protein
VGGWLFFSRRARALTEKDTIVLADFANSTGDAVFDDTLKQGLAVDLGQSPFLNILPEQKVRETLGMMGRSAGERVAGEVARELCQRTGSKAMLAGSISNLGSQFVIGLQAVNCPGGYALAQEQVLAARKEDVLRALGQASRKLREKLGESLSTIQRFDTPLEQATTPSLEALKAYSLGKKTYSEKSDAAAIPLYKRAIEQDPRFAMAYVELGVCYSNLAQAALASQNFQKAYKLRDRVSEREKLSISALYYTFVTGELENAIQTYELWAQAYPREYLPHARVGSLYSRYGQYERAVAETLECLHLDPGMGVCYGNLMLYYAGLGRLDEAKATYQQAMAHKLERPQLHLSLYRVAFLQGDVAEMQHQAAWAAGKPGAEDEMLSIQSDTEAFSGRLGIARELSRRAIESARRNDQKETAVMWGISEALREAEFGNAARARDQSASLLPLASAQNIQALAALALARSGDGARAEKLADELAKRFPLDTMINRYWIPTIRASIEVNRGNPAKALDLLQTAAPYDLARPLVVLVALYPAYIRGQAYLLLRRGGEAAAEFQKFFDHRGVVLNEPLGALAHLGLGRAYALQGDTFKARATYQNFFTLWKDADPDIPILKQAKAEYAKLQ